VGCDWGVVGKDCGMLVCSVLEGVQGVMEGSQVCQNVRSRDLYATSLSYSDADSLTVAQL
jgi:hypothetical protein